MAIIDDAPYSLDDRCPVCHGDLHEHWRGRPCLQDDDYLQNLATFEALNLHKVIDGSPVFDIDTTFRYQPS